MSEKTDKSKLKKLKHVKVYDQLYEQIKKYLLEEICKHVSFIK